MLAMAAAVITIHADQTASRIWVRMPCSSEAVSVPRPMTKQHGQARPFQVSSEGTKSEAGKWESGP